MTTLAKWSCATGKQQNTHWYLSTNGPKHRKNAYTSDPRRAQAGEIKRVGLHNCLESQCVTK